MVRVLHDKQQAIAALCTRFDVTRLDVFGSALRDDFRASLRAAYRVDEVTEQLGQAGLADTLTVEPIGARHLVVNGSLP